MSTEEKYILDYLINSELVEDIESAFTILNSMSDNWIQSILNEEFRSLKSNQIPHVEKRINQFIGKAQSHAKEIKELEKRRFHRFRPRIQSKIGHHEKELEKYTKLATNAHTAIKNQPKNTINKFKR